MGVSKNLRTTPRKIRIWASREQSQYIKTKPIHPSQQLVSEDPTDHSCIFSIRVVINFELYSVLLSYGPGIRVLSPARVARAMQEQLQAALAQYESAK